MTKGPDGNMIDLTDNYKYREGSTQERTSFKRAKGMVNLRYSRGFDFNDISTDSLEDVLAKVNLEDKYRMGDEINFSIRLINNANVTRSIFLKLMVNSVYYNGEVKAIIEDKVDTITLDPKEGKISFLIFCMKILTKFLFLLQFSLKIIQ